MKVFRWHGLCLFVLYFGQVMGQGTSSLGETISELQKRLHLYGYFATRYEKVFAEPALQDGTIIEEDAPGEFSHPFFHIMVQQQVSRSFKIFINLNGADFDEIDVRNAWGEYSLSEKANFRIGKIYRKFGLYNELLDAVPAYFGIEPPELFDADHLLISRTTNLMFYGTMERENGSLNYSLTLDDGEGGSVDGTIPLGMDLHYSFNYDQQKVGMSAYSSNGDTVPDKGVGEGPPRTGVLPWMAEDEFSVFGGYWEGTFDRLTLQMEYWNSPHDGRRDPAGVVEMVSNTDLLPRQRAQFLLDPNGPVSEDNVIEDADYDVETWYIRAGWSINGKAGEWMPYLQWDWYSNPETIQSKTYGGDNEAGAADDGEFSKGTIGLAYRPTPNVAIKCDVSSHYYKLNGEDVDYPEIRLDVSFVFGQ